MEVLSLQKVLTSHCREISDGPIDSLSLDQLSADLAAGMPSNFDSQDGIFQRLSALMPFMQHMEAAKFWIAPSAMHKVNMAHSSKKSANLIFSCYSADGYVWQWPRLRFRHATARQVRA